jgi:uncharacterized protein YggE
MKSAFLTLPVLMVITSRLVAQVDGNYEAAKSEANYQYSATPAPAAAGNYYSRQSNYLYNQQQAAQTQDRNPATSAYPNNDEITININGLMNVVADNYVAVFNVIQVGSTARAADSLMNNRIGQFKTGLKSIGVDTSDIKLDMISFVPKYEFKRDNAVFSKKYNEIPIGFELQKNVYIHFKHSRNLDAILSMSAQAEIYDLVKVDYFIPNTQKLLDSLRLACIGELRAKVKSCQMAGFKLDTLKKTMADGFKTIYPETKYLSYVALSHPSISAIKKRADDQPYVNQANVPYSRFYSQVNYDSYDIVINPVITEPVVQLSYTLNVKYILKEEEKPKSFYYVITTNGEVKQINVK